MFSSLFRVGIKRRRVFRLLGSTLLVRPAVTQDRLVIATIVAPCSAPITIILAAVVQCGCWPFHYDLPWIVGFSLITGFVGLCAVGLPLVYVLRRVGRLNLISLALSGALAGVLVFYLFGRLLAFLLESSGPFNLLSAVWGAALGFILALVFGLIAGLTTRSTGPAGTGLVSRECLWRRAG
jgi:hypothetical protein